MKNFRFKFNPLPFLLLFTLFLVQCKEHCGTYTYTDYEPVFLSFDEIRSEVIVFESPHVLKKVGKIYFKDTYLFINEINEGIHIIDNSNPSTPNNIGFIKILGNVDIAIKGNILFADSYTDLLSIDISDIENPRILQRVENVFQNIFSIDPEKGVIVDFEIIERTVDRCDQGAGIGCDYNQYASPAPVNTLNNAEGSGKGGSLARFSLYSTYLYVLANNNINVYNLVNTSQIKQESTVSVGSGIETLWAYQDKLFIGSTTGMYIFDNSNPVLPSLLSVYEHVFSCDPVVVEGNLAYVTLRSGNTCNRGLNQLEVIDISDPSKPTSLVIYPMSNPHGLGIDNGILFVSDGDAGLKIYDAKDTQNLIELAHYQGISSIDVIPLGKILLMIGKDGFYQYDYSDVNNIKLLSKILVE